MENIGKVSDQTDRLRLDIEKVEQKGFDWIVKGNSCLKKRQLFRFIDYMYPSV